MVIKFFLEFLKFEFTLGFHKNIKKKKKYFMLTVKNYFAFVLQKIAMVANQKFCNKSFIFYPIYMKHINIKNIFFSYIICNNSKNDKKNDKKK